MDKTLSGEDIHKSLSVSGQTSVTMCVIILLCDYNYYVQKSIKHIEIEHVHEQTTTLLAKLDKQGTEQKEEAAKLSSEQRKEVYSRAEGSTGWAEYQGEYSVIVVYNVC